MKKTQIIELFNNIKNTFVSFFSITLFVALGVGIFVGMSWGGISLVRSIIYEEEQHNFKDLEIISPYGFTREDIAKLRQVEGVETVEGTYNYYSYFYRGNIKLQAKICTLPKEINTLFKVEGTLPTRANEIVVQKYWADRYGIKPGDTITFLHDASEHPHALSLLLENEDKFKDPEALLKVFEEDPPDPDGMQVFKYDTYTVSALAESPDYISSYPDTFGTSATYGTPVDLIMYFPEEAFDEKSFTGYSNIFIKSSHLKGDFTNEAIKAENDAFKDRVEVVVKELTANKNKKIVEMADTLNKDIESAPEQITIYQKQIESGQREIDATEQILSSGRSQLENGRNLLNNGKRMIDTVRGEIDRRLDQFESFKDRILELYPQAKQALNFLGSLTVNADDVDSVVEAIRQDQSLDKVKDLLTLASGFYAIMGNESMSNYINDLVAGISEVQTNIMTESDVEKLKANIRKLPSYVEKAKSVLAMVDHIDELIDQVTEQLEEQLENTLDQIENSEAELNRSSAQVISGQTIIEEGKQQLKDAQEQLNRMKEMLDGSVFRQLSVATSELKDYSSAVLTKSHNPTNASAMTMLTIFGGIRISLASLFFIVGILVCYSALSRIIYSHITLLGTKKALGLMKREITLSYMFYGLFAAVMGCILGLLLGYFVLEPIIQFTLSKTFVFTTKISYFNINEAAIVCIIEIVFILLTTYIACRSLLKEHPVTLLAGPKPPSGRHRFFEKYKLWKRLSLFSKTMVNNLLMDKRRVLGTLIGITGCTAMLVCGTTIKLNTDKSASLQFRELIGFDSLILFDAKKEGCKEAIAKLLADNNIETASFMKNCIRVSMPDGRINICYLYISDDEKFTDYYLLRNNGGRLKEMADGVKICNGYGETFNIDPGDKVEFVDNTGQHFFIPYVGEFECYNPNINMVLPADTYEKYSKDTYRANSFTLTTKDVDMEKLQAELEKIPGFITVYDYLQANMNGFNTIAMAADIISLVAVVLAAIMAFLVLLNLLAMHVEEKRREMIILMINGYSVKESKKYIYKDTIFLTIIGIAIGCILGTLAGDWNIYVFSYLPAHFYRGICWEAILFGIVVAAIMAFINAAIAMRRIKHFNLTDINK